jgi:hypothetical protein
MSAPPTLKQITADLRRLLGQLERLGPRDDRPLADRLLDVLASGPLTTAGVRRTAGRRQADVLSTLKLLETADRVKRVDGRWSLIDE